MIGIPVSPGVATVQEFAARFAQKPGGPITVTGLMGRVLRGSRAEHFQLLSTFPGRRLAWVFGPETLEHYLTLSPVDIILSLGKGAHVLQETIAAGAAWKLAVFPAHDAGLADWDGLLRMTATSYPEIASRIHRWANSLRRHSFADIFGAEYDPASEHFRGKPDDPRHMSVAHYQTADDTLINCRRFLWHSLGVNHAYTGSGRTIDERGGEGPLEYLIPNKPITELGGLALDLPID